MNYHEILWMGLVATLSAASGHQPRENRSTPMIHAYLASPIHPQMKIIAYGSFTESDAREVLIRDTSTGDLYLADMSDIAVNDFRSIRRLPLHDPNSSQITTGDFDGDGRQDLLLNSEFDNSMRLVQLHGPHSFIAQDIHTARPTTSYLVGRGRFNGDAIDDLLWFDPATGKQSIWLMNRLGTPQILSLGTGGDHHPLAIGDFNGDGISDISVRTGNFGDYQMWLLQPHGGIVTTPIEHAFTYGLHFMGVADFDGNGRADLLWDSQANLDIWHGNGRIQHYTISLHSGSIHDHPYQQDVERSIVEMSGGADALSDYRIEALGDFDGDGLDDVYLVPTGN